MEYEGYCLKGKRRLYPNNPKLATLDDLYRILTQCWRKETAYPSDQEYWQKRCPSIGQCAITAMLVYDLFGGEIYRCKNHYYNKIDGIWVDLTARQFWDFGDRCDYAAGRKVYRNKLGQSGHTKKRYDMLVQNICDFLNK